MSMNNVQKNIVNAIPYARRYGRALTGDANFSDLIISKASINLMKQAPPSSMLLPKKMILPWLLMEFHQVLDSRNSDESSSNPTAIIQGMEVTPDAPLYEKIDQALYGLTQKQRRVFLLTALEQFRPAVISRILSISSSEVKQQFQQAHLIVNEYVSTNAFNQAA